eukprot:comp20421_c0_seq2/m.25899 comp20421_c0_seq2/g.25899  ORF comp20421_c0_seq2/g.25899 comp20421_c0_seq2/m.25899 type:complete len:137 (-) comp20421_c0_seq2:135-545(-)
MQANMSTESIDHVAIQFEKAVTITDSLELPKCKNGKSLSLVRESSSSSVRSLDLSEPDAEETAEAREAAAAQVIAEFQCMLEERTKFHLGYPYNLDFDYGALGPLQKYSINNLGDPFVESNYGVHSRQFEVRLPSQ